MEDHNPLVNSFDVSKHQSNTAKSDRYEKVIDKMIDR